LKKQPTKFFGQFLFSILLIFALLNIAALSQAQEEEETQTGFPVWMLWLATKPDPCTPPGTAIDDSNFHAAIEDWFANGSASDYGDITQWCTGDVTDMSNAFRGQTSFNADISGWDTSNVTDMSSMFRAAFVFNRDIGNWNTRKVTNMQYMFYYAKAFDQDIGSWDVRRVTDMLGMFHLTPFNQDISAWNTVSLVNMQGIFSSAWNFNQNIGNWDVRKVTNMSQAFSGAYQFNQDLSGWDAASLAPGTTIVCWGFASGATAWLEAYGGSIASTPPISQAMIDANCGD
jgi:surface protein